MWATFFDPAAALRRLGLRAEHREVVDFGCGYGTFALPAAAVVQGTVHAFDIEPDMVHCTQAKADALGMANVRTCQCDFVAEGLDLADETIDYVMLFNLLHAEERDRLLAEARRVLRGGGVLAMMHWNYDANTPRGPRLEIRPRPEQCLQWATGAGFELAASGPIELPPHHYGFVFIKPAPPSSRPASERTTLK